LTGRRAGGRTLPWCSEPDAPGCRFAAGAESVPFPAWRWPTATARARPCAHRSGPSGLGTHPE